MSLDFHVFDVQDFDIMIGHPLEELFIEPPSCEPLPVGLRYAFLNGDKQAPVIMSDKLTGEEMSKLIAILEKHRSVFGYSL